MSAAWCLLRLKVFRSFSSDVQYVSRAVLISWTLVSILKLSWKLLECGSIPAMRAMSATFEGMPALPTVADCMGCECERIGL